MVTVSTKDSVPLCVDVDGTLIRTDLLLESALGLVHRKPWSVLSFPLWLMHGRAHFKAKIASASEVEVGSLPYDERVLDLVREAQAHRAVYLCTAADRELAERVADHVSGFRGVVASDGRINLAGRSKAQALVKRFGERGFDYAGNSRQDLHVWRHAHGAIVVNAPRALPRLASDACRVLTVFPPASAGLRAWTKALRVHQWVKNLLIFAPLLAAHKALQPILVGRTIVAFIAFSLCASGVYVLNDLLDLGADRAHPRKRQRPFASGQLPVAGGVVVAPLLTLAAFVLAYALAPLFALALLGYYVLTLAYSFYLKQIVMVDVLVLASLYTVRIIAGAAATSIAPSFWLLAFSMFLFVSLALVKRYAEVRNHANAGTGRVPGRGYGLDDYELLMGLGGASGYVSVLVLALYISNPDTAALYHRAWILWSLCPLLLYWISRVWIVAHRGAMHDDPVVFAISDRVSRIVVVLCAAAVVAAIA